MSACNYQKQIDAIIVQHDAKMLVETAQKIAADMIVIGRNGKPDDRRSVSTSQIRNIFGSSKKIQMNLQPDNIAQQYARLILLKPKLAYICGRFDRIEGLKVLRDCLSQAIDLIDGHGERLQSFFNFFEAILAYHKAKGGK